MNLRRRLDRLAKALARSRGLAAQEPPLETAVERARSVCAQLLRDGSAPQGLDVAGVLAALDGAGAEGIAAQFLQRACALHCEPALNVEIEYQLQRAGAEVGARLLEELAQEHGLA
jgi:hypothetical protein